MRTIRIMTVVSGMLASLAIAPAALAQPPAGMLPTYEEVECGEGGPVVNLHVAGPVRMWDDDGNSYLLRHIVQDGRGRPWGQGLDTPGTITCTGGDFELQGFYIESVELAVVPLPRKQ